MIVGIAVAVLVQRLRPPSVALLAAAGVAFILALETTGTTVPRLLRDWSMSNGAVASVVFRGQSAEDVAGFSGRGELWAGAVPHFLERPWLGRGFQGSRGELLASMPWAAYAHNVALQSLLDLGLLGSVLLFVAFGSLFLVGRVRGPHGAPTLREARVTIVAAGVFELLNGVSDEVFAGAPGYQTMLVFTCVCLAERLRRQSRMDLGYNHPPFSHSSAWVAQQHPWPHRGGAAVNSPTAAQTLSSVDARGLG
jgi:O-antigen ligase